MNTLETELMRTDWSILPSALALDDIPKAILALAAATSGPEATSAYDRLDNVVVCQGTLYPVALPTIGALALALACCTSASRHHVLLLMDEICSATVPLGADQGLRRACAREVRVAWSLLLRVLDIGPPNEVESAIGLIGALAIAEPEMRDAAKYHLSHFRPRSPSNLVPLIDEYLTELGS